ncbi:hypothetical protein F5Y12DRAFT_750763 [Xylaria sp. FL1777]|nr:hypothetical protein F5Y12DRAFT_750763 [Xylaria sp. FL1777]
MYSLRILSILLVQLSAAHLGISPGVVPRSLHLAIRNKTRTGDNKFMHLKLGYSTGAVGFQRLQQQQQDYM